MSHESLDTTSVIMLCNSKWLETNISQFHITYIIIWELKYLSLNCHLNLGQSNIILCFIIYHHHWVPKYLDLKRSYIKKLDITADQPQSICENQINNFFLGKKILIFKICTPLKNTYDHRVSPCNVTFQDLMPSARIYDSTHKMCTMEWGDSHKIFIARCKYV